VIVVGLTGSIGMGKSTAAAMLRHKRIPVFDSDAAVHALQKPGGKALPAIAAAFPGVVHDGVLDRAKLGALVFGNPAEIKRLNAIMHPLVRCGQKHWLMHQALARQPLVVLDIPLLFETKGETRCDAVLVVSAPARIQRQRVLARPSMTAEKLDGVLKLQTPDRVKRKRASLVIASGQGKAVTRHALAAALKSVGKLTARHWPPGAAGAKKPHANARNLP
jgi:dephospho-CoA kinase